MSRLQDPELCKVINTLAAIYVLLLSVNKNSPHIIYEQTGHDHKVNQFRTKSGSVLLSKHS